MTKPSAFTQAAPGSGDGFPYIDAFGTSPVERICDFDQLEAALTVANMTDASTLALIAGNTYTGVHDFGGATSLEVPNSATPTVDANGEIAVDTSVTGFSHGVLKYYGGEELGVVAMPIAQFTSPTDGYVVAYNATNDEFELVANGAGGGLSDIVDDATPQLGGSLDVNGNKIVSVSNGNIDIEPNGTGNVLLGNLTFDADQTVGAGQDNYVLTYDNSSGLISLEAATGGASQLSDLSDVSTAGTTSGFVLVANGSAYVGRALVEADISDFGSYQTADATLDTYAGIDPSANVQSILGAADYAAIRALMDLEAGTDFYSVSGADAAFQPLDSDLTAIAALTTTAAGRSALTIADPGADRILAWDDTAGTVAPIALADITSEASPASGDYFLAYGAEGDLRKVNFDDMPGAAGGISNVVEDTTPQLGGSLDVNGQAIVSVSGGNIAITPDTTGSIILDGLSWPQADGTADYVLKTDGAGQLSWTPNTGSGIANVVEDTTPQLGGMLDVNGQSLGDGTLELLKFSETASAVNEITVANAATGNGPTISATGDDTNIDLNLAAKGSGAVKVGGNAVLDAGDIGVSLQAYDSDLDTWAGLTPSANAQSLVTAANYAGMRALLDLEAGTDFYSISAADATFQPLDADLTTLASAFTTASASGPASLAFAEDTDNGSNTATIIAPASMAANRTITLPDADGTLIYSGGAFHDGFSDFVGNEHIDHTGVSITVAGTANEITSSAGAQDISASRTWTIGLADNPVIPGTGGVIIPVGTDAQRTATQGSIRYNTTGSNFEGYDGTTWQDLQGAASGIASLLEDTSPQLGGALDTNAFNVVASTGTGLVTGTSAGNTAILAAYDVDGASYTTFATLTANNTPTMDLNTAVTLDGKKILRASVVNSTAIPYFSGTTGLAVGTTNLVFSSTTGLGVESQSASTTDAVGRAVTAKHTVATGTAAAGFGVGVQFQAENAAGTTHDAGAIDVEWSTATDTAEVSDMVGYVYQSGAEVEAWRADGSASYFNIPTGWQFAINGTPISTGGLGNVVEDTTPQLGGNLDLNGFVITGLEIGTNVQAYDADLDTWAGITPGTGVGTALAVNVGSAGAVVVNGGALGTPSSGTLSGCSGLPVSGITASTSAALGVGSIELGHASDTTITRVSAGVAAIEGSTILTGAGSSAITTVGTLSSGNATAVVDAASTTAAGKVELAVASEVNTGTSATLAVTPDSLAGSNYGIFYYQPVVFDFTTATATGDGKHYIVIPAALNGFNLVEVHARVITAGTTNSTIVQVRNVTQAADMLSARMEIGSGQTGSNTGTGSVAGTIDTANDDVAQYDVIAIDVDQVSTTPAQGLIVTLGFQLP